MLNRESFDDIVKNLTKTKIIKKEPKTTYSFHWEHKSSVSLDCIKYLRMQFKERNTGKIVEMAIDNLYKEMQENGKEYIEMKILIEKIKIYIENSIPKDTHSYDKEEVINDLNLLTSKIDMLYRQNKVSNTTKKKSIKEKEEYDNAPSLFKNLDETCLETK